VLLRALYVAVLAILLGAGGGLLAFRYLSPASPPAKTPVHVLFIGNSYTMVNDLPGTFAQLAASGDNPVQTEMVAEGGWTLAQHVAAPETRATLQQRQWDYVVLQDQSQIPADASDRTRDVYPAVRQLVSEIQAAGAKPLLFLTWGHQDGWPQDGLPTYAAMQDQLTAGYMGIATELHIPVAPVGEAWRQAITASPQLDLWQSDGSHPTVEGTYLAACVFYAAIFQQSPVDLPYADGLAADTVRTLQTLAANTVLADPLRWHL